MTPPAEALHSRDPFPQSMTGVKIKQNNRTESKSFILKIHPIVPFPQKFFSFFDLREELLGVFGNLSNTGKSKRKLGRELKGLLGSK